MNNWGQRIGLVALLALLAWAAWESRWTPSAQAPAAVPSTPPPVTPPPASTPAPPLSEYQTTLDRPLFFADRRLPTDGSTDTDPGSTPAVAPGSASRLTLTAIVEADGEYTALLGAPGLATSVRARKGDTIAGWRLEEITDDSVTISADGRQETLPLRQFDKVTAPPPPRRPIGPTIRPPVPPAPPTTED